MEDSGFPSPRGGATSEFRAKTYYFARVLPKIAWKWKKLDPEGRRELICLLILLHETAVWNLSYVCFRMLILYTCDGLWSAPVTWWTNRFVESMCTVFNTTLSSYNANGFYHRFYRFIHPLTHLPACPSFYYKFQRSIFGFSETSEVKLEKLLWKGIGCQERGRCHTPEVNPVQKSKTGLLAAPQKD